MSQRRWGWLLLGVCAFSLFLGWSNAPDYWRIGNWQVSILLSWLVLVWIFAVASPAALRWHPAAGAWLAWVAWVGVSCAFSRDPGQGLEAWAWEVTCVLLFILTHAWWGGAHRRAWVLGLWVIAPLAIFLWPRTQAASLLSAAAAACWGIWIGPTVSLPGWQRRLTLAGIGALAFVLFYGSWGACFGFFFAAGLCAVHSRREEPWMVPTLLGIFILVWLLLLHWGKFYGGGLLQLAWDHPITGLGIGLLRFDGARVLPPYLLRLAAETGWIGLGLYTFAVFKSLPNNFKGLDWEGRAAAAALYALSAQYFFEGVPGSRALQILFFSAIACASNWARAREDSESSPRLFEERHGWNKPLWAGALGLALCLTAILFQRSKALAMNAAGSPQTQVRITGLERLAVLEPLDAGVRVQLARELLFNNPSRIGLPLVRLDEAIRLKPRDPLYLGLKAELFTMVNDWERSGEWAEKALALEPEFAEARLVLAESLAQRGDRKNADKQLILAKQSHDSSSLGRPELSFWDQRRYERISKMLKLMPGKK